MTEWNSAQLASYDTAKAMPRERFLPRPILIIIYVNTGKIYITVSRGRHLRGAARLAAYECQQS